MSLLQVWLALVVFDVESWRVIDSESGPVNYYRVVADPAGPYIRALYRPPMATTILGYELAADVRAHARKLRWRWRALKLPAGGDRCGKVPDAAANVYVTWKRGLRYYTLKYIWATAAPRGTVCEDKRNPFVAQDTVVLRSGGAGVGWESEEIDLAAEYRRHFEGGDPDADVPDWKGVAIMSDGDQTGTDSSADYASFVVVTE